MHILRAVMRDHDEEHPKKPHLIPVRRKGDNAAEVLEYRPHAVGPDGQRTDDRDRHLHVSC